MSHDIYLITDKLSFSKYICIENKKIYPNKTLSLREWGNVILKNTPCFIILNNEKYFSRIKQPLINKQLVKMLYFFLYFVTDWLKFIYHVKQSFNLCLSWWIEKKNLPFSLYIPWKLSVIGVSVSLKIVGYRRAINNLLSWMNIWIRCTSW